MTTTSDLLIICASNGENLKLGQRFLTQSKDLGLQAKIIDLTSLDLPLYNPRIHAKNGIPNSVRSLNQEMASYTRWVICAPEYNGSIPPVFSSAVAWLSVQGDDFRSLFNGRPIAMATFSGGGGMELLMSLRIQLTHLGAQVVGRQLMSNSNKSASEDSIKDILNRLIQMKLLEKT